MVKAAELSLRTASRACCGIFAVGFGARYAIFPSSLPGLPGTAITKERGGVLAGRKKEEPLLDSLIRLPWWFGATGLIIILVVRKFWLVWATHQAGLWAPLYVNVSYFFYFAAAIFGLGALLSFLRQLWHGRLLSAQAGQQDFDRLSWREFERVLQEAFRRQGYLAIDTPPGPDGGYDIALRKDGKRYLVQCKHWKSRPVDVRIVRELWGVIAASGADGGFVVASRGFTADAEAFARDVDLKLIDGLKLQHMVASLQKRQSGRTRRTKSQTRVGPTLREAPNCPKCARQMVKRIAKQGPKAGQAFWGCSNFPGCHGILPINGE